MVQLPRKVSFCKKEQKYDNNELCNGLNLTLRKNSMSEKSKILIGAHMSIANGFAAALYEAERIGATVIQIFTANQRQWHGRKIEKEETALWEEAKKKTQITHVMSHGSYLINLGHPEAEGLGKSRHSFFDEMKRCEQLGISLLNFHPGSHLNKHSEEDCLKTIAESINLALEKTSRVTAVIENTAGQGTNMGHRFEHIAESGALV